ncbi:MAG: apolipoprotein N-acyltransferase [Ruminococcaceae bacterium]|nr:apolipoprotein N-acyltransferase [Oscillospiraceae bacterium]
MQQIIKKYKLLLLCVSGLLTAFTVVFPKVGFLEWISLIPMAMVLITLSSDTNIKIGKMYGYGMVFFLPFYLVIYHWFLYMYPLSFMDVPKSTAVVVVLVAWIGLSIVQTVTSSLIFAVFAFVFRCRVFEKIKILSPFFVAALWATIEWSQTIGWWGIPWGRLCLGQTETSLTLLSVSLFGSYFVSFLIVAVNFCIAYVFLRQDFSKVLSVACVCMIVGNLLTGAVIKLTYNNKGNEKLTVATVQGNIPLNEKWNLETKLQTERAHTEYTKEAAENGADLIVWAETAFPYNLDEDLAEYFSSLADEKDVTIIATCFTLPEQQGKENVYSERGALRSYNSLIEVREDGSFGGDIYSKQRRVPFAEFVPMRDVISVVIPPLAELNMLPDDILAGEGSTVMHTEKGNIGGAICFDSVYENITLEAVRGGAQLLIVSTNDAWFDDSAENYMHTSQSKLRAIETGRYIIRSANTGISAIVNPLGEFEQELGVLEEGYIMGDVYLREQTTLYTVIGNLFAYICLGMSVVALGTSFFIYIKDRKVRKEQ